MRSRFAWKVEELCVGHVELEAAARQSMEMSQEHLKMCVWSTREWLRLQNKEEVFRIGNGRDPQRRED